MKSIRIILSDFDTRECAQVNAARIESFCITHDSWVEAVGFDVHIHVKPENLQDTLDAMKDDGFEL